MFPRHGLLAALAAILFTLTAAFHIASAARGYSIYRDQHLGPALIYAAGNIDLAHPVIVGFNANGAPTPQELPVWQALAGWALSMFGPWFGWANATSLLVFATVTWPLFQLAKMEGDTRRAWWTLVFFLSQPIIFYLAGCASADGLALVAAIWFLYCAQRLVSTGSLVWLAPAALLAALSAVTKLPFFFAVGLASVGLLLRHGPRSLRRWLLLAGVGVFATVAFGVWTRYTDTQIALAEFPLVNLRLSGNPEMHFWYFGDWAYRLNPANWIKGAWRLLNADFGSFALVALALAGLARWPRLAVAWIAGGVVTTMIFSHLVLHHSHYYAMFSGGVALLCAEAVVAIEQRFGMQPFWRQVAITVGSGSVLLASLVQGAIAMETVWFFDPYPNAIVQRMQKYTQPGEKLLVQGGGWGGRELILAQRQGLSIWNTGFLANPAHLARLKALGFTKLVMISESPLLHALQATNPGEGGRRRVTYHAQRTPVDEAWPVTYADEDIFIAEIP